MERKATQKTRWVRFVKFIVVFMRPKKMFKEDRRTTEKLKYDIYSESAKFGLSSDMIFIYSITDGKKWRAPVNFINFEVSALPKRALSLFYAKTTEAF